MFTNKKDIEDWLDEMGIENYTINDDLTVDVNGEVSLYNKNLAEIPVQFGVVEGIFDCSSNQLTSLQGCPKEVWLNFYCYNNKLTSLKGCPDSVGRGFHCHNNRLTSLEGCQKRITGNFDCSYNQLTSFDGFPSYVGASLYFEENNIKEECLVYFNTQVGDQIYSHFGDWGKFMEEVKIQKIKHEKLIINKAIINECGANNKLKKRL